MTSTAIKLVAYSSLDWQRALAGLPPTPTLVEFDVAGLGGSPRFGFQIRDVRISVRRLPALGFQASLMSLTYLYLVYAGPFGTGRAPDGLVTSVAYAATPSETVRSLARTACEFAQTKCHVGTGHAPGISRGAYGALCSACWQKVRAFLDADKAPMPF